MMMDMNMNKACHSSIVVCVICATTQSFKVVKLTDNKPFNCLSFLQGKQTKNVQSRKDSGLNSPIDVIDGKSVPT